MPNPAFLVEGHMEQAIIQRLCPGVPVRLIECNGKNVSMTVLSKVLKARLQRLTRYNPVVIIFDREKRPQERVFLMKELSDILDSLGFGGRYILGMPDQTTEVWTLSDWEGVRSKHPYLRVYNGPIEGQNGKSIIKKLLPEDVFYNETTIGVELFCAARSDVIYGSSASFRELMDALTFPCHWAIPINDRFQPKYLNEV